MDFTYVAYNIDRKMTKGKVSASSAEAASQLLAQGGYRVLSLKQKTSYIPGMQKLFSSMYKIPPAVIIQLSRQIALLLESGTDIVSSLELMRAQATDRNLTRVLGEVIADLRSGLRLSVALEKHTDSFPSIYSRALSVGERTGGLEVVLRQMADFMEKEATTTKKIKGALKYPIAVSSVSFLVIILIVTFVLPAFTGLYDELDVELPVMTLLLLSITDWFKNYGLYLLGGIGFVASSAFLYTKTAEGKLLRDKITLKLPLMGRISQLNELTVSCRSMALLFRAGLALTRRNVPGYREQ